MEKWLADNIGESSEHSANGAKQKPKRVGVDPFLFTQTAASEYSKLFQCKNLELVGVDGDNLVDIVWGDARPLPPLGKAFELKEERTGKAAVEKLRELRGKMVLVLHKCTLANELHRGHSCRRKRNLS